MRGSAPRSLSEQGNGCRIPLSGMIELSNGSGPLASRIVALSLLLAAVACGGDGPATAPPVAAELAVVETTLDFDDPPLVGEVRAWPLVESSGLTYAVDLDADGRSEEEGPLGSGVRIGYRYDEPGAHEVVVRIREDSREEAVRQALIVNDPAALETLSVGQFDLEPTGIAVAADEQVVYLSDPRNGRLLAVRGFGLGPIWEIDLPQGEHRAGGGIALSSDEETLYVDVGDSTVAVRVTGTPRVIGAVGPADRGAQLHALPDGTLLGGGRDGLARVDPETGEVLAEYPERAGPFGVSADGRLVAFATSPSGVVSLLRTNDLSVVWSTRLEEGVTRETTAVPSPNGERVYAIARTGSTRFYALDASTGTVERSLTLDRGASRTSPLFLSPAVTSPDGRYVALVYERGIFVVDAATHLPVFRAVVDQTCCVAASGQRNVFFLANERAVHKIEVTP